MEFPTVLRDLLKTLPPVVVKDLLQLGVCPRCVFRFLNVRSAVYSIPLPSPSRILLELPFPRLNVKDGKECATLPKSCQICLGILHLLDSEEASYWEPAVADVEKSKCVVSSAKRSIVDSVRLGGHEYDSFCLEVSLPPAVLIRERSLWCHLTKLYTDQGPFFGDSYDQVVVSLKESVKWSLIEPLEKLLGAKFDANSTFRIALLYKHPDAVTEIDPHPFTKGGPNSKKVVAKRKRNALVEPNNPTGFAAVAAARSLDQTGESWGRLQHVLDGMTNVAFSKHYPSPPKQLDRPCDLTVMCWRNSVYVAGRYLKFSRNVSQSRWLVDEERMGSGSVQEIVGDIVFPFYKADSYKFHAAGREDIDVRMLGNGRPFLLEFLNARVIPSSAKITNLETQINSLNEGLINVRGLQQAGSEVCALMREGEKDKQKEYVAVVWLSRAVSEADFTLLSNLKELEVQQKTPVRVLHRRSPLVRPRTIYWMRCEAVAGSEQYFILHLCTQAGTYVKEFVHGDFGRSFPSLGSLLGCEAEILQLDVTRVKMDFQ